MDGPWVVYFQQNCTYKFYVEYYDLIAMLIVLHLLNNNRGRVTGFY
jgi:hypothetical protein